MAAIDTDLLAVELGALHDSCGVVDRSERGKLALTGAGAIEFLNGQVTNELADLRVGEGRYAAFLTHKGKMLGDMRVLAVGDRDARAVEPPDAAAPELAAPQELLLDTERVALQALFDMIRHYKIGFAVELHKRTIERGLLSLIGPDSTRVAGFGGGAPGGGADEPSADGADGMPSAEGADGMPSADGADGAAGEPRAVGADTAAELPPEEHASAPLEVDGIPALAIRTDVGVDLLCDAADTERLHEALVGRGASAVSEQAAECLRVERGRPRYGVDIDASTIPQEAGLNDRAVSFTKGCYVGQETVARLHWRGKPNRHLRGLRLSAPVAGGEELRLGERSVGHVGSVALSPALGPIALALVRREAAPGDTVAVGDADVSAEVVELPFGPLSGG